MAAAGDKRVSPQNRGPWPRAAGLARAELGRYLDATADPALAARQSLCPDWTVSQVTAHLAATFARFAGAVRARLPAAGRRAGPAGADARADQRAAARG